MGGHLPIGAVVAGYRVLQLVGEGSGGTVYLVEREDTGEQAALKVLAADLARDERFRRRFLRESAIARGLSHRQIVPVIECGEMEGSLFLAMRYIDGSDLRELLARGGPLAPADALRITSQVGQALDAAHAAGLVHRDVKPANILVDRNGEAYLGDFGLAKHASTPSSLTGEQAFVGTIAYVAPEQIRGERVDGRADVYSLACVLYEALTGRPPFGRETELAVLFAHLHEQVPRASDVRPELPAGLDRVLRAGTAKDPKERYASCGALVEAARRALAGERGPRERRSRSAIAAVAAAIAVVAAAAAGLIAGEDKRGPPPVHRLAVGGNGLALINARTRSLSGRVSLPGVPSDVVFDRDSAWALLGDEQSVVQVDVRRHTMRRTVKLSYPAGGLAIGGGSVFVTERGGGPGVVRISTRTGMISARWSIPTRGFRSSDPSGVAVGAGSVWLARGAEVVRVDARGGRVQRRFPLSVTATLLRFAGGDLWAASSTNGLVEKIDPAVNRIVARVTLHGWLSAMTVAGGSVWVTTVPDDVVFRLNVDDASVEGTARAAGGAESLTDAPGAVFVAGSRERVLARLDIGSGRRTTIALAGTPNLVRYHSGALWIAATAEPAIPAAASGPQVRVAAAQDLTLDWASGVDPTGSQLAYATCMKLVNYPDAAGAAGRRLRPEAAAALPTRSVDGRTYTFRIRNGLRFSPPSGAPLDASAFKRTLERTLAPELGRDSQGLAMLSNVVGARAFNGGQIEEVRGIVARGSRLSITLQSPAGDLASRLATPLFCAVPADTPAPGHTRGLIPSAGPYYVRAQLADRIIVDRNPNYRGPRPRRPARIVYLTGVTPSKAVALADGDQADVVPWNFDPHSPVAPGGSLALSSRSERYNAVHAPGLDLVAFNTRRTLFRDPRLRRAVNYALDRPALARVFEETPTDRYVPPAVPGASRKAIYPVSGPDLPRARRVAGGGPVRTARLYFCGDPANLRIARIVRANLRPIGIRVAIVQSLGCLSGPDPKVRTADLQLITRATPLLDPEPFLDTALGRTRSFGAAPGVAMWSDRAYRDRLAHAALLNGDARLTALARIEDDILRKAAPFAAYASFVSGEYISARSACRVIQGAYGVLDLAALCVRGG